MAGVFFQLNTPAQTPSANPQTILQIVAASNHRVIIRALDLLLFGSTGASAPLWFDWAVQDDAGTSSSYTSYLVKRVPAAAETLQTTALGAFTAEPSTSTKAEQFAAHQQSSGQRLSIHPQREIIVPGGTRMGLRILSSFTAGVAASVSLEE